MLNIGQFFKKIQNRQTKELFARTAAKEAIQEQSGVVVRVEDMSFKAGALVLKGLSQGARSQIFIKKQAILEQIRAKQQIKVITDIH
jgi:hypothetical protein